MKGIILGILSGLIPGLHPNLFGSFLSLESVILMLVFYRFFSYLKEIFFMVPSESNVLSLHPIYKLYKKGLGYKALLLGSTGVLVSVLISILISPILVYLVPKIYFLSFAVGIPFLIFSLLYLILTERSKLNSIIIILASGFLGFFALRIQNGIIPLLSGLFSIPILISKENPNVEQKLVKKIKIKKKNVLLGILSSVFLVITPAIGPAQSAMFTRGMISGEDFIFTMGIVDGLDIVLSVVMLLTVGKSRIGALEEIRNKYTTNPNYIPKAMAIISVASIVGYILVIEIGRLITKKKFNLKYFKMPSLVLLSFMSFFICGIQGIIIFSIAGGIGILANKLKVRMVNCMGSLAVPLILNKIF